MIAEAIAAACNELRARDAILARLGGLLGESVRAAAGELAALPPAQARSRRAMWAAAARAPAPPGLRGVHPSWIEAALDGMPARTRGELASGPEDPVGVWLARRACAAFPPMPAVRLVDRVGALEAVLALPESLLESWLENVGAEQVAVLAIASKTVELVQRQPGVAGARLRQAVHRVWPFFRKDLLGYPVAQIARRCAGVPFVDSGLLRIGARTIAPYVATRLLAASQLVHRLPRERGLVVDAELRAFASAPIESVPSWRVLSHVSVVPP